VTVITFHELRYAHGRAGGVATRKLQEWLGHADVETTQIYTYYAPDEYEIPMVNEGFGV